MSEARAERAPRSAEADIARTVSIPPRPALLVAVQREMSRDIPHLNKVVELINRDSAMAGNLLATANSAFYSPGRRINAIPEAIALLGTSQCAAIMTGLITRRVLGTGGMMMARFWDVSEKRAKGLAFLAREIHAPPADLAYNFGLFCDIGIPLLKARFGTYLATLTVANQESSDHFLQVENTRHGVNHAQLGALLAEKWGLAPEVIQAIRAHHSPAILQEKTVPATVRTLIACNYLVEKALEEYRGKPEALEWRDGGALAMESLGLSPGDVENISEGLKLRFAGLA